MIQEGVRPNVLGSWWCREGRDNDAGRTSYSAPSGGLHAALRPCPRGPVSGKSQVAPRGLKVSRGLPAIADQSVGRSILTPGTLKPSKRKASRSCQLPGLKQGNFHRLRLPWVWPAQRPSGLSVRGLLIGHISISVGQQACASC